MEISLGTLEENILMLVMLPEEQAYPYAIVGKYQEHIGKKLSISAVHAVLTRLEKKGYLQSAMEGATKERGGRRKRIFTVTKDGENAIRQLKASRQKLWSMIPHLNFSGYGQ